MERDLITGHETLHELEGLGRPRAAGSRVDAAELELARIVTAHADPQGEPARSDHRDRRELARDRRGVAQGEQVDAGLDRQRRMCGQQRRRLDQAVYSVTSSEADVVADGYVIDAGRRDGCGQLRQPAAPPAKIGLPQDDAHHHVLICALRRLGLHLISRPYPEALGYPQRSTLESN